jgi:outer membrane immunogenic protein
MRRWSIALIAAASTIALMQMASAADLPVKAPRDTPPPLPPPYSWTGFYVGGNIGYSWGHFDGSWEVLGPPIIPSAVPSGSGSVDGVIGGGQIGYNWQVNDTWLLGVEADFQGSGQKGSFSNVTAFPGTFTPGVLNEETKLSWFGTVRGRIGVLLSPTFLVYGTGGLAYGRIKLDGDAFEATCPCHIPFKDEATKTGWTAGGGVEGAFPNTRNWTWKVEYLYMDLNGTLSQTLFDNVDYVRFYTGRSENFTDNIVRAGVNYRFW